jgi:hypothetical protein
MTDDPRDTDGLPSMVREAIARANAEDGSEAQVARLAARVAPMLGLSAAASLAPGAAAQAAAPKLGFFAGKLAIAKVALTGGIVAGVALGTIAYRAGSPVPGATDVGHAAPPSSRVVDPKIAASAALPSLQPAVSASEPPAPSMVGAPGPQRAVPPPARSVPSAPSAGALNEEARLLKRAGALLGSDPAGALAAADEHRNRFPAGALVHERDVLSIRALIALGRRGEAAQRLGRFERAFPSSPHLARFRETLGQP